MGRNWMEGRGRDRRKENGMEGTGRGRRRKEGSRRRMKSEPNYLRAVIEKVSTIYVACKLSWI